MSPNSLWKAVEEFNQQEFYCCHDTLEALWMEASEPQKTFYQGILQIAVACYHMSNNNWRGAVILLGEGIHKLVQYEPDYLGIDISSFTESSYQILIALQQTNPQEAQKFYEQLITTGDNIKKIHLPVLKYTNHP